jgi:hypothetical protein
MNTSLTSLPIIVPAIYPVVGETEIIDLLLSMISAIS